MRVPILLLVALTPVLGSACRHTLQRKVEASPEQRLELYTTTATYLYEGDDLLRAQEQAVKALEIEPGHRAMRRMIGWIRLRLGKHEDLIVSERFFRDLMREGDDNDATVLGLATATERLGTAYEDVSQEVGAGRRSPSAGDRERVARERDAQAHAYWKEARGLYQRVIDKGDSTAAMNGLQRVTALQGDFEASLEWSDKLLERSTAELESWRRLLTGSNLSEREESVFRENERIALELQTDTHLFAATLLFRLGRYDAAVAHLDAVVRARPTLPQAYSLRAQMLVKLQLWERAIADLDRYLALSDEPSGHPDVQRAWDLRTECEAALRANRRG